ncbi:MAG: dTDP-glucose 4,6-dehydratase [Euryarchaeota archaeon]|nr:dTDP-glucose 4,6-dehydratase [Euryarchaeota archaeon]
MRILVTGGAGFIGANFVHHLLHRHGSVPADTCCPDHPRYAGDPSWDDVEVVTLDALTYAGDRDQLAPLDEHAVHRFVHGDIRDPEVVDQVLRETEPDAVVHFAAESHVDRSIESGLDFVTTNVVGTQVLLDAARRYDVARFLHVSTDEVYGSIDDGSFTENHPYDPSSPYSASKAGSDLLVRAHHRTYGLPVTVTRCTNNYGPRQNAEKLLPKTILRAQAGKKIPVYGDGMNVRDWLYVKDHCQAIEHVFDLPFDGSVYNIAGRTEVPNIRLIEEVLDLIGRPRGLVEFVTDRLGHDRRYSLDDSRLRSTGWEPRTELATGLAETIAWYTRSNPPITETRA